MIEYWVQLALTRGVGPVLARRLIEAAGGVMGACSASRELLESIEGIGPSKARSIHASLQQSADTASQELDRVRELGFDLLTLDDPCYPPLLRLIPDPPLLLYVRGKIEPRDLNAVAIVGSRRCSLYGREQAQRFAGLLGGAGFTVISGGARGIDSSAHQGAMVDPNGRTIAVLGCGLDQTYPPENKPLFDRIAQQGAVISEYPLGTAPVAENFPRRNRIVSGMSRGVLVVEADLRSGALITARQACEDHGRPVFAIPGRIDHALSAGCHQLIREGAVLTEALQDIIDNLGPLPAQVAEPLLLQPVSGIQAPQPPPTLFADPPAYDPTISIPLDREQQAILKQLDDEALPVDVLVDRTELPAHVVLRHLTHLSLKGLIQRIDGQTYARRTRTNA